jgi:hypothetical protein
LGARTGCSISFSLIAPALSPHLRCHQTSKTLAKPPPVSSNHNYSTIAIPANDISSLTLYSGAACLNEEDTEKCRILAAKKLCSCGSKVYEQGADQQVCEALSEHEDCVTWVNERMRFVLPWLDRSLINNYWRDKFVQGAGAFWTAEQDGNYCTLSYILILPEPNHLLTYRYSRHEYTHGSPPIQQKTSKPILVRQVLHKGRSIPTA